MLQNEKIIVAGAGGLLGSKLVSSILQQNGFVIALDIDMGAMKARLQSLGVNINHSALKLETFDITNELSCINFFSSCDNITGAVNATYPRNKQYGRNFFDVTLASFNENLSLHLGSAFLFSQQCAAYFKKNTSKLSVVNISSIYGAIAPKFDIYENTNMTMPVEYAAIKSAILHLNKYIVAYVKDSGFRINSVSPGGIYDAQSEAFLSKYKEQCLGKGMLDVEDVLGAIIFLLSDQSKYINGQNIIVDDGFSL
jgi:NAD(P)-dependent dehydrogenase (short-subunit alcohol dehydrogenase family)